LVENNRGYLLEPGRSGRVKEIIMKVVGWAKEVKQRIAMKKIRFSNELKVYNLVRQNYLALKGLYDTLGLSHSNAIYIHKSSWATL
jgi:hypothetical protein